MSATRTFGLLELCDGVRRREFVLREVEPHVVIRMKQIFPRIAVSAVGEFRFPADDLHCTELDWFIQRYPMRMAREVARRLREGKDRHARLRDEIEGILLPSWRPAPAAGMKEGQELRAYEAVVSELLLRKKALVLGDDVGLGKTYSAIGAMLKPGTLPAAAVVPKHLQRQWKQKIEEFSHLRVHLVKKRKPYKLPEADVYIFRYSVLIGWIDLFSEGFFETAVFDEVQELRTGTKSDKGKAAARLVSGVSYALGLTATPIYNYGIEVFNILDILAPGALGSRDEFVREWCAGNEKQVRDPKAPGAFLREQHLLLRRTKADVGQQIDRVNRILEEVDYDEKAVRSVEERAQALALRATTGAFVERGQAYRELDMLLRQATGVSKARSVAEFSRILLENDVPILLAGWHRAVYDIWLEELREFRPLLYTGSESEAQKERNKQAFIDGETNALFISLRSSPGLDGVQHRCSTVVVGELDWSPQVHHQLIGRVDREGQKDQVMALFLYSNSGSDPVLMEINGLKAYQAHGIVDPYLGLQEVHSDRSRMQLLAEQFLERRKLGREMAA